MTSLLKEFPIVTVTLGASVPRVGDVLLWIPGQRTLTHLSVRSNTLTGQSSHFKHC